MVTAGGSRIGRGIAQRLAEEGCRVVVGDIDREAMARMSAHVSGLVSTAYCDVRDEAAIASLVSTVVERHGRLDCAVNVAGFGSGQMLVDTDVQTWDACVAPDAMKTRLQGTSPRC